MSKFLFNPLLFVIVETYANNVVFHFNFFYFVYYNKLLISF